MKFRRETELFLEMHDATGRRVMHARDRHRERKHSRWLRRRRLKARDAKRRAIDALGWIGHREQGTGQRKVKPR